ncbi:MAG: GNAT family N-acetyltransferase [Saprospiraceae bacterium]|nr:GNAT family N-acetyltransferase [Saprospiraceae bacterium]
MEDFFEYHFDEIDTQLLYQLLAFRQKVFVVEQECPYQDLDFYDLEAYHVFCKKDGVIYAYARVLPPNTTYQGYTSIGRVASLLEARKNHLGTKLMQFALNSCQEKWPSTPIKIGAQAYLVAFYESFGFVLTGEPYIEDGIPHEIMIKTA